MTTAAPAVGRAELTPGEGPVTVDPATQVHPMLFWLLVAFFVLEYARPPGLPLLRLQAILVLVLPLLWLGSRDRPWNRILTYQLVFFVSGAAMIPIAYNYFSVYLVSRLLYGNIAIAIAVVWVLRDWNNFQRIMWLWLGIMCYQALFALGHGGRGSGGFIGDENDLALACVTAFPLAFVGFRDLKGWTRWACGAAAVLLLAAVVVSFSRGGFIGLVGASAYCILVSRNRLRTIALGLTAALLFFFAIPSDYKEEISTIRETTGGTAEVRLFLWVSAANMWLDHPVLGVGPGNSAWQIGRYQPEPTESGLFTHRSYQERNWTGTVLHSLYFEILAERGLLGVVLMTAMLWLAYRTLKRIRIEHHGTPVATHAIAVGGALTGVLTGGAFLSIAYYPYLWYLPALAAALGAGAGSARPPEARDPAAASGDAGPAGK